MQVAVVGAGINGLYLAWKLSEKGHKVVVFDRNKNIGGSVVCSGLFSQRILDFVPQSKDLVKNRINYVLIHFPKKTIKVNFSKQFLVIDHAQLDQLVAGLAEKSGADILLNYHVKDIPKGFDRIIGSDGANSIIRRKLKLKDPKYKLGVLGFIDKKASEDFVEVWPEKSGFSWQIPRGENMEKGFIKDLGSFKPSPLNKEKAKIIAQGLIVSSNASIALCGDAAGLTKPWSGGGVIWGLTGADILLESFPDFNAYQKKLRKFFQKKIILSKLGVKTVYFFGFKTPWLIPKEVGMESDFIV